MGQEYIKGCRNRKTSTHRTMDESIFSTKCEWYICILSLGCSCKILSFLHKLPSQASFSFQNLVCLAFYTGSRARLIATHTVGNHINMYRKAFPRTGDQIAGTHTHSCLPDDMRMHRAATQRQASRGQQPSRGCCSAGCRLRRSARPTASAPLCQNQSAAAHPPDRLTPAPTHDT